MHEGRGRLSLFETVGYWKEPSEKGIPGKLVELHQEKRILWRLRIKAQGLVREIAHRVLAFRAQHLPTRAPWMHGTGCRWSSRMISVGSSGAP